jgi:tight adherence protein B
MRIDDRLLWIAFLTLVVFVLAQAAAQADETLQLGKAGDARFPSRSFVLTLPEERALEPRQVRLTENGEPVEGVHVTPGDAAGPRTFGVVLAIDASDSMQGEAISDAMAAARAFAARRQPNQSLGVVFFSRTARVALAPTTDAARIDAVLSADPPLTGGTRIYDATDAALGVLQDAGITSGSIVLLSDGADGNSATTAAELDRELERRGARVYGVGLRSAGYERATLEELAGIGGGTYGEATSSKDLAGIFDALGRRLGNQYLIEYRSESPLGARVEVAAQVDGLTGTATTVYQAPSFTAPGDAGRPEDTVFDTRWFPLLVSFLLSAVIGLFVFWVMRPGRRSVRSRIAGFVAAPPAEEDTITRRKPRAVAVEGATRAITSGRWWAAYAEQVEIARVAFSPARIAVWTLGVMVALAYLFGAVADRPLLAVSTLGIPLVVRAVLRVRVARERRAFADQLSENLQVLASAMRAGHSFLGALAVMADDAGEPARGEFKRVLTDERLGIPVQEALATVARRMRNPDVEYVGLIAQLQTETGGNTAEVLDRVTETIRERHALHRMVRTLTAQGRLGGWVVSLMPVGLVLALNVLNPNYLSPLYHTTSGRVLLGMGAACIVSGMFAIRKIVDIKV